MTRSLITLIRININIHKRQAWSLWSWSVWISYQGWSSHCTWLLRPVMVLKRISSLIVPTLYGQIDVDPWYWWCYRRGAPLITLIRINVGIPSGTSLRTFIWTHYISLARDKALTPCPLHIQNKTNISHNPEAKTSITHTFNFNIWNPEPTKESHLYTFSKALKDMLIRISSHITKSIKCAKN